MTRAAAQTRDVCNGLVYLHDIGIVHRDLKVRALRACSTRASSPHSSARHSAHPCVRAHTQPENLIYVSAAEDARVKISDFGLAKVPPNAAATLHRR